ncbi:unnamed protein product [Microthlaspi erraticum]|uniref:Integrase catalytic domain-containing protein n=1 Tax=Microthlaspi erraticum TaxID=1685480 RepID=A0A6D2IT16_9BRAS|nr:unnamed protein product [Microthlaspi erraticum]
MSQHSLGGCRYFVLFIDDYSKKVWVYFLRQKSDVFDKFKIWKAEVENQTGRKVKYMRLGNGIEYTDGKFVKFCEEHGIQRHYTLRKTPQQNGLHCYRQSAIFLAKNQVYHSSTKHIHVRFNNIRELATYGEIIMEKVHTSENAADMLTKPVTLEKFKHFLELFHVFPC